MKRPHNFYKIWEYSNAGQSVRKFTDKCDEVSEKARLWVEEQGADSYIESPDGMAGGVAALIFGNCISKEGFERVTTPDGTELFVPTPDSELEKEMYALPLVVETELISLLQFKVRMSKEGKPLPFTFGDETPLMFLYKDYWYVDMPYECQAEGMETIEEKDFYRKKLACLNTQE